MSNLLRPFSPIAVACIFLALCCGAPVSGQNLLPWEGEFFTAKPDAVLEGVARLEPAKPDRPEYLLWEDRIEIDEQHRITSTYRRVYRIASRDEIEPRGNVSVAWNPWLAKRPQIRARVITTGGMEVKLDPKTISESSGDNVQNQMYLDNRVLSAPLPAIGVGAIIETEFVVEEHTPFCPVGISDRVLTQRISDCHHYVVEVSAPTSLPLELAAIGQDVDLTTTTADGVQRWRYHRIHPKPLKVLWEYLGQDTPVVPFVSFCTGRSWGELAKHYHSIVEQQITDANLANIVQGIQSRRLNKRQRVELAARQVQDIVRYSGVEFGVNAIRPAKPQQVLERQYGDCKDQTALLIAMLRELGIDARAALLSVGSHFDVVASTPGLDAFDHVIVHLPKQDGLQELWLDLTSPFTTFGALPTSAQGRLALIADPKTTKLKRTPKSSSNDNARTQTYLFDLNVDRPSRMTIESVGRGYSAALLRSAYADGTKAQILESATSQYKELYGLTEMLQLDFSDVRDTTEDAFKLRYDFWADQVVSEEDGTLFVNLFPGAAFGYLPYQLVGPEFQLDDPTDPDLERPHPFVIHPTFTFSTTYRLKPPKDFRATPLPLDQTIQVGSFLAELTYRELDDRSVEIQVSLDTGDGELTSQQVDQFREEYLIMSGGQPPSTWTLPVTFYYEPQRWIDEGETAKGIKRMIATAEDEPDYLFNRGQLARSLVAIGLGEEARQFADELAGQHPESARAHATKAWTRIHDFLGNTFAHGMDRQAALESFERAIALLDNRDDVLTRYNHAVTLEFDDFGGRYTDSAAVDQASQIYQDILKTRPMDLALQNYSAIASIRGNVAELRRLHSQYPGPLYLKLNLATAEVKQSGVKAAARAISRVERQNQAAFKTSLALGLRGLRQYPMIKEFMDSYPETTGVHELLFKLKTLEEVKLDPSTPESALQSLLVTLLDTGADLDQLRKHYSNSMDDEVLKEDLKRIPRFFLDVRRLLLLSFGDRRITRDVVSLLEFQSQGDDQNGYLVTATCPDLVYVSCRVVRDGDGYRVFAEGSNFSECGVLAIDRIRSGQLDRALPWLNIAYEAEKSQVGFFNPLSASAFAQAKYVAGNDPQALRAAAILLAFRKEPSQELLTELESLREQCKPPVQLQIDRGRLGALIYLERYDESLQLVNELLKGFPISVRLLRLKLHAELRLQQFDQAEQTLKRMEGHDPISARVDRLLFLSKSRGYEAGYDYYRSLEGAVTFSWMDKNNLAWRGLFAGKAAESIPLAREAVERSQVEAGSTPAGVFQTLASLYAETGNINQAILAVRQAVQARRDLRDPADDYVLGRIAEQCGLIEAARKYYRRAAAVPNAWRLDVTCKDLAAARLVTLESSEVDANRDR